MEEGLRPVKIYSLGPFLDNYAFSMLWIFSCKLYSFVEYHHSKGMMWYLATSQLGSRKAKSPLQALRYLLLRAIDMKLVSVLSAIRFELKRQEKCGSQKYTRAKRASKCIFEDILCYF